MNEFVEKARVYAEKKHEGQTRKSNGAPMFTHPTRVAELLKEAGFKEEVVMAGYLHDTVEDTDATPEEITELFGQEVARIVAGNTENKEHTWKERKQHTIDWISDAPIEVKALIVADKLDNLKSMTKAFETQGEKFFQNFKKGKEEQLWYFKGVCQNMRKNITDNQCPSFFDEYEELVQTFETMVSPNNTNHTEVV